MARRGADAQGLNPLWHLAGAAGASAFNLVAFGVVYAVILQQARLLLEVKDQADRLRAQRYGEVGAAEADSAVAGLAKKPSPGDDELI